jgi:hypothetical protein
MKINRFTLVEKKGFAYAERYSFTNETDDQGRWARYVYYNGFLIAAIQGYVIGTDNKPNPKFVKTVNKFYASLYFPCSSNQGAGGKMCNTLQEAKDYTESMFNDFKKIINE